MRINNKEYNSCPCFKESTGHCLLKQILTPSKIIGKDSKGCYKWRPKNYCDKNCPAKKGIIILGI